jgi:serine/threonine protein phosphatase PrpC
MEYNFQVDSAAVSDRGLSEKRPQNEDSYLELSEKGVFAVADGVGGAQAGDVASQMAVEILGEAFANSRPNIDAEEVMKAAIEQANAAIFQTSNELAQLATMATTIVALHVAGNIATIGHVGDSRLYRLDGNGNLFRETQDHSVVEEEVRAGRMTPAQAANHPSRNVISRALGAESTVEIDMKTIMFEPNTSFLLCSDGITRHIDDFEIRDLLSSNQVPTELANKMKEICYERGAEDNLTAVIVRVGEAAARQSTNGRSESDFEEQTIAVSRPVTAEREAVFVDEAEIPTQNLSQSDLPPFEDDSLSITEEANVRLPIVPKMETNAAETTGFSEPQREVDDAETEEKSGGFAGKLLTSLLLLLVGAVLGAGAYYYFLIPVNKPVEVTKLPTEAPPIDTMISLFEKGRRSVDDNPQAYITAHANDTKNAEIYYLLGRANLLNGNFSEAKKSFDEAKNHLAETSPVNSRVLENDILTGLTIINSPLAAEEFKKKMLQKQKDAPVPTNANVNSSATNKPDSPMTPQD